MSALQRLRVFHFLDDETTINKLYDELPQYHTMPMDAGAGYSVMLFWADGETVLPNVAQLTSTMA